MLWYATCWLPALHESTIGAFSIVGSRCRLDRCKLEPCIAAARTAHGTGSPSRTDLAGEEMGLPAATGFRRAMALADRDSFDSAPAGSIRTPVDFGQSV